ncbi:hypothetical protein CEQ90_02395 [Lewinellaceae bacterium SD302]|nr:hypothetical protein CEQ90_02395 [Lewinellaceae bacterium SD302]
MKQLYFVLALLFAGTLSAESLRGFLVTKDDLRLTGYVNQINYVVTGLEIEFTNDFGDRYYIYPNLVKGFGFTKDGQTFRYVSRYYDGRWYFLEILQRDKRMEFFQIPDGDDNWVNDRLLSLITEPISRYWLAIRGQALFPVHRVGFKRKLREYLQPTAPELAQKIGSKGYRYKNIHEIVAAYEESFKRSKRRL